ncbi:hypothetical protein E4A47_09020 [Micrococcus flavus]|uniref:Uncharacterized protein n=1 Tax=Micrococcus flavus TaxID=384602 RepID=A0A4Y8WYR9_9MICC|nr:hypothetical protein [Micrococcus flavus]MBB4883711.1 hypothetical protein [Micrococcus flavus]TFI00602.1 hypothetical protein E4A47_09020 [Micrococcus flavus]GGK48243.1 hypothetical protein GCM10007073_14140 [Micrococcus flavus]
MSSSPKKTAVTKDAHPAVQVAVKLAPHAKKAAAAAAPVVIAKAGDLLQRSMDGDVTLPAVGRRAGLNRRITSVTDTAAKRVGRTDLLPEEAVQAKEWHRRGQALAERLQLDVSKDKKKAHWASIERDLDALYDEMDAALK